MRWDAGGQAGILLQATKGGLLIDRLGGDFSIILTCSVRVDSEGVAGDGFTSM